MKANDSMEEFFIQSEITITEPDGTTRPLTVMTYDDWMYWENWLAAYEANEKAEAEEQAKAMEEAWIAETVAEAEIERLATRYWEEGF